jgi:hypothetical protein
MEKSFDAIVNESTIFDSQDPQMVLVRGYPGPVRYVGCDTDIIGQNPPPHPSCLPANFPAMVPWVV